MLLKNINTNQGWVYADYQATWKYGYDFMLDAAQAVIDTDFKNHLQRVTTGKMAGGEQMEYLEAVRRAGNQLRDCEEVKSEAGMLIISGISTIMDCPIQLMFYNQSNLIRLCTPFKELFEKNGDNIFTTYLSSIEIQAYCKATERRTLQDIGKAE